MAKRYLPNYLRTYRKSSGLTQTEVAFVIGVNRTDLWQYETARREPSLSVVIALVVLYRIPLLKLFAGIYQATVQVTARRLLSLRSKLLLNTHPRKSKLHIQKLAWVSTRLNLALPALS